MRQKNTGFTLIETLVAVSLLTVAIVAPMSLVSQSLAAAYYARDQVTAYNLAQEGIEGVRAIRDGNVLTNALVSQGGANLLDGIPINQRFTIDATQKLATNAAKTCTTNPCPPLKSSGGLYGYNPLWTDSMYTRTMTAVYVGASTVIYPGQDSKDAIRVTARIDWRTPGGQTRSFTIYENMYRWINDGSAQQ